MKEMLTKAVTHREFLKMCGLAIVGAGAGQMVVPPKPASALYQINDDLYVSGKLGVGTTTPGTVYQFVPSIIEVVAASGNHAGVAISSGALNTVSALNFAKAGTATWEIQSRNELDTPNNRLCFFYNDAGTSREFVSLGASGNVGIGITNPAFLLEVHNTARTSLAFFGNRYPNGGTSNVLVEIATNQSSGNYAGLYLGRGGNSGGYVIQMLNGTYIGPSTDGSAPGIFIGGAGSPNGNIGIGTTNPGAKLEVAGEIKVNGVTAIRSDGLAALASQSYYA